MSDAERSVGPDEIAVAPDLDAIREGVIEEHEVESAMTKFDELEHAIADEDASVMTLGLGGPAHAMTRLARDQ